MRASAAAAFLAGLGLPLLLSAESAEDSAHKGFLEVMSQGYSRFEIEDGNVVANYPEPVVFRYLGYEVHADTLRFNQATSVAVASGHISLASTDLRLNCDAVVLDGEAGTADATGGISGDSASLGISFCASSASVSFPPKQYSPDIAETGIEVSGGISLSDTKGNRLQADSARLDGASRTVTVPGKVRAALQVKSRKALAGVQIDPDQQMQVSCSDASAQLTETDGLESVSASAVVAVTKEFQLNAPTVTFTLQQQAKDTDPLWHISASGAPLSVQMKQKDKTFNATGGKAELTLGSSGITEAVLSGSAVAWSATASLRSERIILSPVKDGFRVRAEKGLSINADMAAVSGMAPINLQRQLQHRGK